MEEQIIKVTNNENPTINLEISTNTNAVDINFAQSMNTVIIGHNEDTNAHSKITDKINEDIQKNLIDTNNMLSTKADKSSTYTKTETDEKFDLKINTSDTTITKQGNTFNNANQLVMINSNGKLPALDGSQLFGIAPTRDTSDMPTIANDTTDSSNDLSFCTGFCWDETLTVKIKNTALTKQLDAAWASGTNAGGLDAGTKATSTTYHCFTIAKADGTSDFLFSTSPNNPTMPSGYTYKRRIGSIMTNASGNIIQFYQDGDRFTFQTTITEYSSTANAFAKNYLAITVPAGIRTMALIGVHVCVNAGYITYVTIYDGQLTSAFKSYILHGNASNLESSFSSETLIGTNTTRQIQLAVNGNMSTGSSGIKVWNFGYIDKRGKN